MPLIFAQLCQKFTCPNRLRLALQIAAKVGIEIEQRCVPRQELKEILLSGQHLVIALVDKDLHSLGLPLWRTQTKDIGFKGPLLKLVCAFYICQ